MSIRVYPFVVISPSRGVKESVSGRSAAREDDDEQRAPVSRLRIQKQEADGVFHASLGLPRRPQHGQPQHAYHGCPHLHQEPQQASYLPGVPQLHDPRE